MPDHASLLRLAHLIVATAEQDLIAAQRLAAHAVADTMRSGGATVTLGEYAGYTSAEVHGRDGRAMVIVPLYDWEPDPELGLASPGTWEYAVRDADGGLLPRPDGVDTFGCASIWHAGDFGLQLDEGTDQHHHMQKLMADLLGWALVLGANDPLGRVAPGQQATDYAVDPYPGQRPYGSVVIDDAGFCWPVSPDEAQPSGWAVSGDEDSVCLDEWLATFGAAPLAERIPLVGYGSNASPGKVLANGTPLPSVHLACTMEDLASVWCTGDTAAGRTPVTLDVVTGHSEEAVVVMCDLAEMRTLDRVEGRSSRWYDLVLLNEGRVVLENGARLSRPAAYVGGRTERRPMRLGGQPLLRVDVDQAEVRALRSRITTEPATSAIDLGPVVAPGRYPAPGECVPYVFVYGTLKPGNERWHLLEPYVAGEPVDTTVVGDLRDTGNGYPALSASSDRKASGVLVECLKDEAGALLELLDNVEGVESGLFTRQLRNVGGQGAWVYVAASLAGRGHSIDTWPPSG
ncbi:hypothetical protein ASG76_02285 [Nocardioides sp. Soil774]|uniref:gamma-glutamylcyclotransferase family protein n=1 Tax=Nocardioides sp. Soil774 TaxID=1736408 RepID=UPI0006F387C0|nr:gamma-glutamylcyclotransferase family protein [Nocardioides sp. Soil774]KRE97557.1 hypothetical protein ASG76_02285 [Nocardioides sp. Soil774]